MILNVQTKHSNTWRTSDGDGNDIEGDRLFVVARRNRNKYAMTRSERL